ncbi:hypothetical protein BDB13_5867 [Rhodococcus sp. OK302]|nr:hypothetical protein BDB13_5867 [Rhodococcus sp. OK302]
MSALAIDITGERTALLSRAGAETFPSASTVRVAEAIQPRTMVVSMVVPSSARMRFLRWLVAEWCVGTEAKAAPGLLLRRSAAGSDCSFG